MTCQVQDRLRADRQQAARDMNYMTCEVQDRLRADRQQAARDIRPLFSTDSEAESVLRHALVSGMKNRTGRRRSHCSAAEVLAVTDL